jgi:hypothetical protein
VPALPDIGRADRKNPIPFSIAQERSWRLTEAGYLNSPAYRAAVRLHGQLDRRAFGAALDSMVERHEILRTTFGWRSGALVQRIAERAEFVLRELDLTAQSRDAREARILQLCTEADRQPLDLGTGPLIRGWLISLAEAEHVFILAVHAIIFDGWSLGILIREIGLLYGAYRRGLRDPLPPLTIQYADFAAWQRDWLQSEDLQNQLSYWVEHLRGAPAALALPLDKERPGRPSGGVQAVNVPIGVVLTKRLKRLAQRKNVSLFMALFGAFARLLARLSGQKDIVIAVRTSNRARKELEALIGPFMNVLLLRIQLVDITSVGALLRAVREIVLGGQSRQGVPVEWIVQVLQQYPDSAGMQPFAAEFAMQNEPRSRLDLDGLAVEPVNDGQAGQPAPLSGDIAMNVIEGPDQLFCKLNYSTDLFEAATVERWASELIGVLEELALSR